MVNNIFLPEVFGPGFWMMAHLLAKKMENSIYLITFLKIYFNNITCKECQANAIKHMEKNKIEDATSVEDYILDFHNHANRATRKAEWSRERANEMLMINLKDQTKIGPGIWIMIHIICYHSSCTFEKLSAMKVIEVIFTELQKIEGYRWASLFYSYRDRLVEACNPDSEKTALFRWSVEIHNEVNKKLRKPILEFEEAVSYYSSVCNECAIK